MVGRGPRGRVALAAPPPAAPPAAAGGAAAGVPRLPRGVPRAHVRGVHGGAPPGAVPRRGGVPGGDPRGALRDLRPHRGPGVYPEHQEGDLGGGGEGGGGKSGRPDAHPPGDVSAGVCGDTVAGGWRGGCVHRVYFGVVFCLYL